MMLVREAVLSNTDVLANQEISLPIPYLYNLPMKPLASFGKFFNVTDCHEWYMFYFNETTTSEHD